MSVGVRLGGRGVVERDGGTGVQIAGDSDDSGFLPAKLTGSLDGSESSNTGAFTVAKPGFYLFSGSTETTGTVPAASTHPGGMIMFGRDLNASGPLFLTGSARVTGVDGVFYRSGTTGPGDSCGLGDGEGGLALWSDGRQWVVFASSGSLTIA